MLELSCPQIIAWIVPLPSFCKDNFDFKSPMKIDILQTIVAITNSTSTVRFEDMENI